MWSMRVKFIAFIQMCFWLVFLSFSFSVHFISLHTLATTTKKKILGIGGVQSSRAARGNFPKCRPKNNKDFVLQMPRNPHALHATELGIVVFLEQVALYLKRKKNRFQSLSISIILVRCNKVHNDKRFGKQEHVNYFFVSLWSTISYSIVSHNLLFFNHQVWIDFSFFCVFFLHTKQNCKFSCKICDGYRT